MSQPEEKRHPSRLWRSPTQQWKAPVKKTRMQVCKQKVRAAFADSLQEAFKARFARELTTEYSIMAMSLVSRPTDGKKFTPKQRDFVEAFSRGYADASLNLERADRGAIR